MSLLRIVHEELRQARNSLALARLVKRTEMSASTLLRELHTLQERLGTDAGFEVALDEGQASPSWRIHATALAATEWVEHEKHYIFDSYKRPKIADILPKKLENQHSEASERARSAVAAEAAVALVFNGISHAVLMASPAELADLARGFAWSEGIVDSTDDVRSVEVSAQGASNWLVEMEISTRHFERLKAARRTLAGPTGCGLCGIESLDALAANPTPTLSPPDWLSQSDAHTAQAVLRATAQLADHQPRNARTGALHAAVLCTPEGNVACAREDVGRHNALDKLLGACGTSVAQGLVLMSSRASVELVRKCARAAVPLLATVSAPTTLAISTAKCARIQLWAFARDDRVTRYA